MKNRKRHDTFADEAVIKWSEGKSIKKVIVMPGRLVNIAVG